MPNNNCLEGMKCSNCGYEDNFLIRGTATFDVYDSGSSEFTELEWERDSFCKCRSCNYHGLVREFMETPDE